jgi:hypothetical protein
LRITHDIWLLKAPTNFHYINGKYIDFLVRLMKAVYLKNEAGMAKRVILKGLVYKTGNREKGRENFFTFDKDRRFLEEWLSVTSD